MRIVALRGSKIFSFFFSDETRWVVLCCCAMEESGWDSISLLFSLQHDRARCYAGAQSSQERRDILNTTSWNCLLEIGKISLIFFFFFFLFSFASHSPTLGTVLLSENLMSHFPSQRSSKSGIIYCKNTRWVYKPSFSMESRALLLYLFFDWNWTGLFRKKEFPWSEIEF